MNVIEFCDYITNVLDHGSVLTPLDFSKAFDMDPHNDLIKKLYKLGLNP